MHLKPCTIREICRLSAIAPTSYSVLYTSCHAKSVFPYSHKRNSVLFDLSAGEGFFEKCWKEERHLCVYVRNEWLRFCYGKSRVSSSFKRIPRVQEYLLVVGLLYIGQTEELPCSSSYPSAASGALLSFELCRKIWRYSRSKRHYFRSIRTKNS